MRISTWAIALVAGASLVFSACDAGLPGGLLGPEAPTRAIVDGRDDADRHVFFLSPITSENLTRSAPFNAWLDLRIEVCRLDAENPLTDPSSTATAECEPNVAPVATFDMEGSGGSGLITLNTEVNGEPAPDSSYSTGWKTTSDLAGSAYRVQVIINDDVTAYADMILGENSAELKDLGDNYGDVAGRNIPIKLIAEMGAGCDGLDCYAVFVTCEGGTFRTAHAGAVMPANFAAECGTTEEPRGWWLYQERIALPDGQVCLPTNWQQFDPCYIWRLEDTDGNYYDATFVEGNYPTLTYCIEDDALALKPFLTGFRAPEQAYDATATYEGTALFDAMTMTPETADPFTIECPYQAPVEPTGLFGMVTRAGSRLASMLGLEVRPLYAGDTSTSTRTSKFSHFSRVLATMFAETSGDAQTGLVSSTLPLPLSVKVTSIAHHEAHLDHDDAAAYEAGTPNPGDPVPGHPVTFTVTAGGGMLSTSSDGSNPQSTIEVDTDSDGYAQVYWTLGPTAGEQTVDATGPHMLHPFGATAVDIQTNFLPPLADSEKYPPLDEVYSPTVNICPDAAPRGAVCNPVASFSGSEIKTVTDRDGRKFYQVGWKPTNTGQTEGRYFVQTVIMGATVAGHSVPIEIVSGGKDSYDSTAGVYYTKSTSNVEIKFQLYRP